MVCQAPGPSLIWLFQSFFDKSINGAVIALLEQFKPSEDLEKASDKPVDYYRYVMVALTGLPSILIFLFMLTIIRTKYGRSSRANSVVSMH